MEFYVHSGNFQRILRTFRNYSYFWWKFWNFDEHLGFLKVFYVQPKTKKARPWLWSIYGWPSAVHTGIFRTYHFLARNIPKIDRFSRNFPYIFQGVRGNFWVANLLITWERQIVACCIPSLWPWCVDWSWWPMTLAKFGFDAKVWVGELVLFLSLCPRV